MSLRSDVWRAIDARQDELFGLCAACVRIPAPNPPGDTEAIAAFVRNRLADNEIDSETFAPLVNAPNLVAALGNTGADGTNLVVNSHLDTFPPAAGMWTHSDPHSGVIEDGRLYGCGAADMRASLGMTLFLVSLLKPHANDLPGSVTLAFVSDEETGGDWGSEWLLDNVESIRGDACLIGDQCGTQQLAIAEKGMCHLTVAAKGLSSHAAYGNDASATHRLLSVVAAIRGLEDMLPPQNDGSLANRLTVNIGTLAGGVSANLVADRASAKLDVRIPPWLSSEGLLAALNDAVANTGIECELSIDQLAEPSQTAPEMRIVRTALDAIERATGESAQLFTRIGASDARLFRARGIPTIVYGPGPNNMGSVDEFVSCNEILTTARVHAAVMLDFLEGAM